MTGRSRRVYFEDEVQTRRTRGHSQNRRRSLSADRVHSIYDDANMQDRERVVGREAYDQLLRENQYLTIELRDLESTRAWADQLRRENADLQRENRELRRSSDYTSDNEARKDSKLRKKYAKLEGEVSELKTKLAEWKSKAGNWRKLYEDLKAVYDETKRREEDAQRRVERMRDNMTLVTAAKDRLEQENATLRRGRELEERLRRRVY
jgi:chromosome segregation ATPase